VSTVISVVNHMNKLLQILSTIPKLGYRNVAYMAWYRYSLKSGLRKYLFPVGESVVGLFYKYYTPVKDYPEQWKPALKKRADEVVNGNLTWFWCHRFDAAEGRAESLPNWFRNPFTGSVLEEAAQQKHWTELGDFDLNTGDIKILWEPSRFYWLVDLARAYRVFGDEKYLETMNNLLEDWSAQNPLNVGPNWKCGQETSIRILNLVQAADILDQGNAAESELCKLINQHLKRVAGNLRYAVAQDNNHGTSEAAGLIVGAAFLRANSDQAETKKQCAAWLKKGRKLLEERVDHLIAEDGSFSQHSVNYHRMLLDTLTITEKYRQKYELKEFSGEFYKKYRSSTNWLEQVIDADSGRAPNLGHNDGSRLLNSHSCDYVDYRPTVQAARAVADEVLRFDNGPWDESLYWLGMNKKNFTRQPIKSRTEKLDGQYLLLNKGKVHGLLRLPGFRFRPAQNDLFHLDLWIGGKNIACDAGTYSYSDPEGEQFASVERHNTVQAGSYEPMPKNGKFLHSHWVQRIADEVFRTKEGVTFWEGKMQDYRGNRYHREITASVKGVKVRDRIDTDGESGTLRWHLPVKMNDVRLKQNSIELPECRIVFSDGARVKLKRSERSLYYLQKEETTCVEVDMKPRETVTTVFKVN